jgi:two-component system cell cycle response regulator DivK
MSHARNVLVIDDDHGSRRLVARWLEEHGWQVLEAPTGQAALELARGKPLSLVVLDLRMPGSIDGLRAASLLRQLPGLERVPIIAVSASPQETSRHRALGAGCSAFLSKPVDLRLLLKEIERCVPTGEPR